MYDRVIEGDVISADERVRQLEDELSMLKGRGDISRDLVAFVQNPKALTSKLNLNYEQARNVKALVSAGGTGLSVKHLGKYFGDELAAVMGAAASAFIARKIFG